LLIFAIKEMINHCTSKIMKNIHRQSWWFLSVSASRKWHSNQSVKWVGMTNHLNVRIFHDCSTLNSVFLAQLSFSRWSLRA
jgi:hypothetical protein